MLPYGYSVSIIISMIPPIWRKVIDPLAKASNLEKSLSKEEKEMIDQWISGTLFAISVVLTYLNFFYFGFN